MKTNICCFIIAWLIGLSAVAQTPPDIVPTDTTVQHVNSDPYISNMLQGINVMDKAMSTNELQQAAAFFEQMTEENAADWLPPYYAAYCYITMAFLERNAVLRDNYLDQAQSLLDVAKHIDPQNAEIAVVQAYSYQVRTAIDPATRMPEFGTLAVLSLEDATQLDANNPRLYYIQAQNLFLAPETQGGGLAKACPIVRTAAQKYALKPTPTPSILPKWGAAMTDYMNTVCEKMGY
jgi:hypothetical protein